MDNAIKENLKVDSRKEMELTTTQMAASIGDNFSGEKWKVGANFSGPTETTMKEPLVTIKHTVKESTTQ